jgi:protein-tyrosine phosphatase
MTQTNHPRQINFDEVFNFRDLGGYRTHTGRTVAWRRLFRSSNFCKMTDNDLGRLSQELGVSTVLDLRSSLEIKKQGLGLLSGSGIRHCNISLIPDGGDKQANERRYEGLTNLGEFYVKLSQQKEFGDCLIEALKVVAEPASLPLVFHCSVGKDRTGIFAAFILSVLDVADEDIINDYSLTIPYVEMLLEQMKNDAQMAEDSKGIPDYFWEAGPKLMEIFLTAIKLEYGSARGYLQSHGAETALFDRLEKTLLIE